MNNKRQLRWNIIGLLLTVFSLHQSADCSVCETCICSSTDEYGNRNYYTVQVEVIEVENVNKQEIVSQPQFLSSKNFHLPDAKADLIHVYNYMNSYRVLYSARIVNCRGKRLEGDTLRFDLLMFDEESKLSILNLSENEIFVLPRDIFRNLKNLKTLNLSQNRLQDIPHNAFNHLESLTGLDLSQNNLTVLPDTIISRITKLELLNLSHNKLSELNPLIQTLTNLTWLDVSHNNLNSLANGFLHTLTQLQHLDLSFNKIVSLGIDNLVNLTQLTTLNVNNNHLVYLSAHEIPASITNLNAGYNMITFIPETFTNLKILDIEYNEISELDVNSFSFSRVESLNFSGNKLSDFPNVVLKNLDTLDLSFNELSAVPESIKSDNFPQLSALIISGNPIRNLKINSELNLELLIARSLDLLESIEESDFTKLGSLRPEGCLNLTISYNKGLRLIHEKAFADLNLCSLDLSSNNLSSVSPALISRNGLGAKYVVNLQGNPFHCDCSLQWMLVDLIPALYALHSELLDDLRCASPPDIKSMRMVHWYNWKEQVFCKDSQILEDKTNVHAAGVMSGISGTIKIESSTGMLAALIGAAVVLSMMVAIGIVWARRLAVQRSRRNRRF